MTGRRRSVGSFLGSARLAAGLMVYLALISFVGTLVPQGGPEKTAVARWAVANPGWEPLVRSLGLHAVYSSWYFLAGAALLAASTSVCAWRRTTVARKRFRILRDVRSSGGAMPGSADYGLVLSAGDAADPREALERAGAALAEIGVRGTVRDDAYVSASSPWGVWGSPAFHWALVALFLTLATGALFRSDGLMGLPEGVPVKDEAAAYGVLTTGPLFNRPAVDRTMTLDRLHPSYVFEGMDRGASPEITLRDGSGRVLAHQVVYPNNAIHAGTLTIHTSAWGLAPKLVLLDKGGSVLGSSSPILDFSDEPSASTEPGDMEMTGGDGGVALVARATIPLDLGPGVVLEAMPATPTVRIELLSPDGAPMPGGGTLRVGETLALPDGSALRLERVGDYARISVVDDPTIPLLYGALTTALVGVTFALLARQRLVVVALTADDGEDPRLEILARTWRNAGTSGREIRATLESTLRPNDEEASES